MDFKLINDSDQTETAFTGDDRFRFDDHGLLVVTTGEVETTFSPAGWTRLVYSRPTSYVFSA